MPSEQNIKSNMVFFFSSKQTVLKIILVLPVNHANAMRLIL